MSECINGVFINRLLENGVRFESVLDLDSIKTYVSYYASK